MFAALQLIQTPAVLNDFGNRCIFLTHLIEQRDRQRPDYPARQIAARSIPAKR